MPAPTAPRWRQENRRHSCRPEGDHGRIHRDKSFKRGEPLPVVMVLAGDPIAFFPGGLEAPYGVFEPDPSPSRPARPAGRDGARQGNHGLPFPANAEIVLEGYCSLDRLHAEGPFGEWTGHHPAVRATSRRSTSR